MLARLSTIFAVSAVCFVLGGGWHFFSPSDQFIYGLFYRLDTPEAERWAWTMVFVYCGPAAAIIGAFATAVVLVVRGPRQSVG